MTALQLFQTQSPFWATGLTLERIKTILTLQEDIKTDLFFEYFNKLIELENNHFSLLVLNLKLNYGK